MNGVARWHMYIGDRFPKGRVVLIVTELPSLT